ncbi:MAG: alpha/beta fold hydrolase [Candidatus Niyogibacteria bacterium]|nr:alpha/beta fold hydrolase [Candidatus Niyogibacteria bacterium]
MKISLLAKDGVKIMANLAEVEKPAGWLILIHMMPATKESWQDFAEKARDKKYESVAIDLRGHGESGNGPDGFLYFTDEEHRKSVFDIQAAADYLINSRGAALAKIFFIGASIGANLSLKYLAENQKFPAAILLSAGLNYRGIKTEPLVKNLQAGQKVFFASAKDDRAGGNNAEMNRKLYDLTPAKVEKQIKIFETGGHGTDLLKDNPKLENLIFEFLKTAKK